MNGELSMSHIINDVISLNSEIMMMENDTNKEKNIVTKILDKRNIKKYKTKLLSIIDNIANNKYYLNRDDLLEFFRYVYNNYPPNGTFESIEFIKKEVLDMTEDDTDSYVAYLSLDDIVEGYKVKTVISISYDKDKMIDLKISYKEKESDSDYEIIHQKLKKLYIKKSIWNNIIDKINDHICFLIHKYLTIMIKPYMNKEGKGYVKFVDNNQLL